MLEAFHFQPEDRKNLERALYYAPFVGKASAMVVKLQASGLGEKAEIFEQERRVWDKRVSLATEGIPHHFAVAQEIEEIIQDAYQASVVVDHYERSEQVA